MGLKKAVITSIVSSMFVGCNQGQTKNCFRDDGCYIDAETKDSIYIEDKNKETHKKHINFSEEINKNPDNNTDYSSHIFMCLSKDNESSFTYKNSLQSIHDLDNTILEVPISHLFHKYGDRVHPLYVRGVPKTFGALLGKGEIEKHISYIPQKLQKRQEQISSQTVYAVEDTIRFKLINPKLVGEFNIDLSAQLNEKGFENFKNNDAIQNSFCLTNTKNNTINHIHDNNIYDIVVKKLGNGKSALALYKDGKLFMSSYVSVGLNSKKTKVGQFEILGKYPYYKSRKYRSPMPNGLKFDEGGYFFHQGNVTGYPASHGCVRLPGIYALCLYSLVKDSEHTDVFIDENLYSE